MQLGQTGWILGDLPNLLAGAMQVKIFVCDGCGKIEMYLEEEREPDVPSRICPRCGAKHDFDDPKCPNCKFDYYKR